jgi:hypothetical protein
MDYLPSMRRQSDHLLRQQIRALSLHPWLNDAEDKARLAAAKAALAERRRKAA